MNPLNPAVELIDRKIAQLQELKTVLAELAKLNREVEAAAPPETSPAGGSPPRPSSPEPAPAPRRKKAGLPYWPPGRKKAEGAPRLVDEVRAWAKRRPGVEFRTDEPARDLARDRARVAVVCAFLREKGELELARKEGRTLIYRATAKLSVPVNLQNRQMLEEIHQELESTKTNE